MLNNSHCSGPYLKFSNCAPLPRNSEKYKKIYIKLYAYKDFFFNTGVLIYNILNEKIENVICSQIHLNSSFIIQIRDPLPRSQSLNFQYIVYFVL